MNKNSETPMRQDIVDSNESDRLNETNRNSNGGILVTDAEIKAAFEFFDAQGTGKLSFSNLKERLEKLTYKPTKKEIRTMMDGKDYITLQEIQHILKDNELLSIDPYKEAFSILDPTNIGYIAGDRLKKIFSNLGFGSLSDEELQLLISTGDADQDGRIGLSDFILLGSSHHSKEKLEKESTS